MRGQDALRDRWELRFQFWGRVLGTQHESASIVAGFVLCPPNAANRFRARFSSRRPHVQPRTTLFGTALELPVEPCVGSAAECTRGLSTRSALEQGRAHHKGVNSRRMIARTQARYSSPPVLNCPVCGSVRGLGSG